MNKENTDNIIKLGVVGTLCLAFLGLFGLAYLKLIDANLIAQAVLTAIATIVMRYVTQQQEQAKAQANLKSVELEMMELRKETK